MLRRTNDRSPIKVSVEAGHRLALPWQLGERVDDRIRHHPTGVVMIPESRIQAIAHYTARTPTHGHLREAFVVAVEPMGSDSTDCAPPRDPSCVPAR